MSVLCRYDCGCVVVQVWLCQYECVVVWLCRYDCVVVLYVPVWLCGCGGMTVWLCRYGCMVVSVLRWSAPSDPQSALTPDLTDLGPTTVVLSCPTIRTSVGVYVRVCSPLLFLAPPAAVSCTIHRFRCSPVLVILLISRRLVLF